MHDIARMEMKTRGWKKYMVERSPTEATSLRKDQELELLAFVSSPEYSSVVTLQENYV